MRKWNISLLEVILLLTAALPLYCFGTATVEQKPTAPTGLKGVVDAPQKAEIVIPRSCLADAASLHKDFEMHIPIKEDGEPDMANQYSTGTLEIHPKQGTSFKKCAVWHVVRSRREQ